MRKTATGIIISGTLATMAAGAEIKLPNAGFENWEPVESPEKSTFIFGKDSKPKGWGAGDYSRDSASPKTAKCSPDKRIYHGGKTAIRLESEDDKSLHRISLFNQPVMPNKYYRVSVWLKGENITPGKKHPAAGIAMQFIPGQEKNYWTNKRYHNHTLPTKDDFEWQKFSYIFQTYCNEKRSGVTIGLQKTTGTLWIDDIALTEVSEADFLVQQKAAIKSRFKPTVFRKHYGPASRQVFSLYQAKSTKPTPVLVQIHGGGWLANDGITNVEKGYKDGLIKQMNDNGITVAVINYRYSPLPNPVYDAARAIQYLRYNAKKYNLDKTRFAATGFSAGATTSLWLALHDDLADPNASYPIARESTRLTGAFLRGVQSSIDPITLRKWKLEKAMNHAMIHRCAGFNSNKEMNEKYETKQDVYKEFSPITHASKDDPLVRIDCGAITAQGDWIHHGRFGYEFKKHADKVGAPCDVKMTGKDTELVPPPKDANANAYLVRILTK